MSSFLRYLSLAIHRNVFPNNKVICRYIPLKFMRNLSSISSQTKSLNHNSLNNNIRTSLKKIEESIDKFKRTSLLDIDRALENIMKSGSVSENQSLLLLKCCGNMLPSESNDKRTALANKIWNAFKRLNVPLKIEHFNSLLKVYLENDYPFSPIDMLAEIESNGLKPDRTTYEHIIARFCQQGDINDVTVIIETMKKKDYRLTENIYCSLITGHANAGNLSTATAVIDLMKEAELTPGPETYFTLMKCYAKIGNIDSIHKVLNNCCDANIPINDSNILDTIFVLSVNGYGQHIDSLLLRLSRSIGYHTSVHSTILSLILRKKIDEAYKLLKTMPRATQLNGELFEIGNFFLKNMIKCDLSAESILLICQRMNEDGLNSNSHLVALEFALQNGAVNTSIALLKEVQTQNLPIRQHYFWPLICSEANKDANHVLDILRMMRKEFKITPDSYSLRNFIVPKLCALSSEQLIAELQRVDIDINPIVSSLVYNCLQNNKIREAYDIAKQYTPAYSPNAFRKPLINALVNTQDFETYIKLVRIIYESIPKYEFINSDNLHSSNQSHLMQTSIFRKQETLGDMINDAIVYLKNYRSVEHILKLLYAEGLSLSRQKASFIKSQLSLDIAGDIPRYLNILSSGDLKLKPSDQSHFQINPVCIEMEIKHRKSLDQSIYELNEKLFNAYYLAKNLEKCEEIVDRIENEGETMTVGNQQKLLELMVDNKHLDRALKLYEKLIMSESFVILRNTTTLKFVQLLIENDQRSKALKILNDNRKNKNTFNRKDILYSNQCYNILNFLAQHNNAAEVERFFTNLKNNNYIRVTKVLLQPLINVHVCNNDLKKAVEIFEQIATEYHLTPLKDDLTKQLIINNDMNKVEKVFRISCRLEGYANAVYDLAFTYIECGQIDEATKILQEPTIPDDPKKISLLCRKFVSQNKLDVLYKFLDITKQIDNRHIVFDELLDHFIKEKMSNEAIELWQRILNEAMQPSKKFLIKLGTFLQEQNIVLPFSIPSRFDFQINRPNRIAATKSTKNINHSILEVNRNAEDPNSLNDFFQNIKSENIIEAITNWNRRHLAEPLSNEILTSFMNLLLKNDHLDVAIDVMRQTLTTHNIKIHTDMWKEFGQKLANSGNVNALNEFSKIIDIRQNSIQKFNGNLYCKAFVAAGRTDEYLEKLIEQYDNAKTAEDYKQSIKLFPENSAIEILSSNPALELKYVDLVNKYQGKNLLQPLNALWMYYFIQGQRCEESYNNIWSKKLSMMADFSFKCILHVAKETQDFELLKRLLTFFRANNVEKSNWTAVYKAILDVYIMKEMFREAVPLIEDSMYDECYDNINRNTLIKISNELIALGEQFPFELPHNKLLEKTDPRNC